MGLHPAKATGQVPPGVVTLHIEGAVLLKDVLLGNLSFWKPGVSTSEVVWSLQKSGPEQQVSVEKYNRTSWVILALASHPPTVAPYALTLSPSPGQLGPQKNNQMRISDILLNCYHSMFQNPVICLKILLQKTDD